MGEKFGRLMMREEFEDGIARRRIMQADSTAVISPILVGQAFAGETPYLQIRDALLTISDDFGQSITYTIGRYVTGINLAGFVLQRVNEGHHYETHTWDDEECIVCGVTWTDCSDTCPEPQTRGAT